MTNTVRLFISHASDDTELARRVVLLFRAALNLPAAAIRCTSVDGHRLAGGADTDEELRRELRDTDVFVGILSAGSMRSTYVLVELGARWVLDKHLLPLLAPRTPASVLGGPLAGKNALRADSEAQLYQMVTEVANELQITPEPPGSYLRQLQDVAEWNATPEVTVQIGVRDEDVQIGPTPVPTPPVERKLSLEDRDWLSALTPEAGELLKAAAADPNGAIMHSAGFGGAEISTNGRNFVDRGVARSEARWRWALQRLEEQGLVEDRGGGAGNLFFVTDQGFRVADLLE
jgi:hypothetical protein